MSIRTKPLTDLDAAAVAHMAGTAESHIWFLCRKKRIPHYRIGNSYRFNSEEIRRWLEENHVTVEVSS